MTRSPDEQGKLNFSEENTTGRGKAVKPLGGSQRVEQLAARAEGMSSVEGEELWAQVWGRENLTTALKRVEQNGGAPGIDGMRVQELHPYLKAQWLGHKAQLDTGTYKPSPVRRVEIPKPDGGVRLLGIPTVLDRFIQQALLQALTPLFEPQFSTHSYGFRPKRSAHQAVKAAQAYVQAGYAWVVDLDLDKFFDRVNHDMLMARVARVVKDKRVLKLLRRYLESGVMVNGVVVASEEGTPQGGPLSPLLGNIMLDDLDKELERRGHQFVRYADDCNIYVRTPRAGERVLTSVRRFVEQKLKLKVNEQKSKVDRPSKRKTRSVGFRLFGRQGAVLVGIAPKAVKRCRERLRELTRRTRGDVLEDILNEVNMHLRGWTGYFRLADTPSPFEELDEWLRRRLRQLVWKRWKKPRTRQRNLVALGLRPSVAYEASASGKGYWRLAASPPVQQALGNAFWHAQGLLSAKEQYHRLRAT